MRKSLCLLVNVGRCAADVDTEFWKRMRTKYVCTKYIVMALMLQNPNPNPGLSWSFRSYWAMNQAPIQCFKVNCLFFTYTSDAIFTLICFRFKTNHVCYVYAWRSSYSGVLMPQKEKVLGTLLTWFSQVRAVFQCGQGKTEAFGNDDTDTRVCLLIGSY